MIAFLNFCIVFKVRCRFARPACAALADSFCILSKDQAFVNTFFDIFSGFFETFSKPDILIFLAF